MKSSRFAVGLVGLALAGLWYCAGGSNQLPASSAADAPPRVAAPLAHENLSVYFVYGPDAVADAKVMNLQEALDRDLAVVHETSNVNVLAIENRSPEYELFVQSGDIVKGGKQDRMVQSDMLLPPKSGVVALPAHCVEQGRWTGRGAEDAKKFSSSAKCAVGNQLKIANYAGQQTAVWDNVKLNQDKLNDNLKATVNAAASPTSFQLTLESSALVAKVAEYEAALKAAGEDHGNVIGVVFAVNGQITGAEVYGSNALFRKAWPKLLNAAAVEAVADRTEAPTASAPSAREVERFLAYGASAEPTGAAGEGSPLATNDVYAGISLRGTNRVSARGVAVNANEEMFQTEGRAPGRTNELLQTEGRAPGLMNPRFQTEGNVPGERNRVALPAPVPNVDGVRVVNPALAAVDNVAVGGNRAPRVQDPTPENRLNSNRTENRSTLMVESRDPARANAIIHRSYIKK